MWLLVETSPTTDCEDLTSNWVLLAIVRFRMNCSFRVVVVVVEFVGELVLRANEVMLKNWQNSIILALRSQQTSNEVLIALETELFVSGD
jgi:hypothetical protein